ncbi:ribbon-helix-helix domain-containing protein [Sphingosinicellaceae bacterium]|nr:ribbon-helix-helix domain-containing protein [Sphingosinicellaceae bacterium]
MVFGVSITASLLQAVDTEVVRRNLAVDDGMHFSRSAFVREALLSRLRELQRVAPAPVIVIDRWI